MIFLNGEAPVSRNSLPRKPPNSSGRWSFLPVVSPGLPLPSSSVVLIHGFERRHFQRRQFPFLEIDVHLSTSQRMGVLFRG